MARKSPDVRLASARQSLSDAYEVLHFLGLFDYAGDVSVRAGDFGFLIRRARVALASTGGGDPTSTAPDDILLDRKSVV